MGLPRNKLRIAMIEIANEYRKKGEIFKKTDIIAKMEKENPDIVKDAQAELYQIAMTRILNDNLFSNKNEKDQADLFKFIPNFVSVGRKRPDIHSTESMSLKQLVELTEINKSKKSKKEKQKEKYNNYYKCMIKILGKSDLNFGDAKKLISDDPVIKAKFTRLISE
jgi:hypothetical protein